MRPVLHLKNDLGGALCRSRGASPQFVDAREDATCVNCVHLSRRRLSPDQLRRIKRMGGHAAARNPRTHPSVAKQF